ncbi:hypothetical protein [Paraburkholderia caffeinilytica]|uniref:hypothetical protein n=1 Tax=Paraburkholderia caffeinilytica TaxID=1761016 RepID=UPI003DA099BE
MSTFVEGFGVGFACSGGGPVRRLFACLPVCLWHWFLFELVVCVMLSCLCFYGVGLSLFCYWIISVRPCAGQAPTFFAAAKKVGKESGSHR